MFPKQEAKKEFGNPEILPYPIFTMYLTLSYKTQGLAIAYLATLNLAILFIMIIAEKGRSLRKMTRKKTHK